MTRHVLLSVLLTVALFPRDGRSDSNVSLGGFLGAHMFSPSLDLGIVDPTNATSPRNSISFGVRAGYQLIPALRLEGELATTPTVTRRTHEDVTVFGFRTQALVDLLPNERLHPFALIGVGLLVLSPAWSETVQEDTNVALHAGVGAEYEMAASWSLRLDVRMLLVPSMAGQSPTSDYEVFVGLTRHFSASDSRSFADSDGDGVHDSDDACPSALEDQDGYLDEDGCPDPDNDGDGILDASDQCPADAESMNGIDDEDGCPEPDGDGDGIVGSRDRCPQQAGDGPDGCPVPVPTESANRQ